MTEFGRTIKLGHTLFALPFAVGAAALADPPFPPPAESLLLLACMVTARTAAMGMNRVADAKLDAANPRTADRAIPAGRLRRGAGLALALASGAAFIGAAWGFLPLRGTAWPGLLAPGFVALLYGYSWTKRVTAASHWVLGLCLGLAPVGVWIALGGEGAALPFFVGTAVLFWTAGFDILYALQDQAFDREAGLRSVPARFGTTRALRVAMGSHGVTIVLLALALAAGRDAELMGWASAAALGLALVLLGAQHTRARRIAADTDEPIQTRRRRIAAAFFPLNAAVSTLWMTGVLVDVIMRHA